MSEENPNCPKDSDFEKIFEEDRFDPTLLNPTGTGNVDEGRNYYRGASHEGQEGDDSSQAFQEDGWLSKIRSESGSDISEKGHFDEDYGQNKSGKKKKDSKSGKGRRPSDGIRKKSGLATIPGDYQGEQQEEPAEQSEHRDDSESFPWKSKHDVPILQSEPPTSKMGDNVFMSGGSGDKEDAEAKKKAKFTLGEEDEHESDHEEDYSRHREYRRQSHHHHHHKDDKTRINSNMSFQTQTSAYSQDQDEENLRDFDKEDMGVHRFEKAHGMSRHKITRAQTLVMEDSVQDFGKHEKAMRSAGYGFQKNLDHTPHNLFVEMDELENNEWVEKARWIKYEEDLEADAGRWGKPHVSSLSFRSLINVRKSLENGVMLLDLQEKDLPGVMHRVVEALSVEGILEENQKPDLLRILNYRHKYVQPHHSNFKFHLKRSPSQKSLPGLLEGWNRSSFRASFSHQTSKQDPNSNVMAMNGYNKKPSMSQADLESQLKKSSSSNILQRSDSHEAAINARKQDIVACLEEGTEGCLTLVGGHSVQKPICAFVRLGEALVMQNTIEVTLPMRFIYILLTPEMDFRMDPHEIGRSFSTLMANRSFHNVCYGIEGKRELLHAINIFLDDSVVLPPGDWNKQKLLAMADIMDMRKRREERRQAALKTAPDDQNPLKRIATVQSMHEQPGDGSEKGDEEKEIEKPIRNPLQKSPRFFGGLIDDIKYRYPLYLSDIKDGMDPQVLAATIFIYFAALSGAVAFGGLMGEKTNKDIGITETLLMSSVSGALFAMFAGCPLIIIGTTGPVLLFDEALYQFCESSEIPFLNWRTWIGVWTLIIAIVVAFFQGSLLVKFFTRFTKDIFAALISLLFIFEAFNKLSKIFAANPILVPDAYCNATELGFYGEEPDANSEGKSEIPKPNKALLATILMLGTFFIGYFLRIFRNSKVFGRNARRALGDFGVPIAIVIMVLLNYIFKDAGVETLNVPAELTVSNPEKRGWFINPVDSSLQIWTYFAGVLPAMLLYVLLFMETSICQLIMLDKTKGVKGVGVHLDIVILSALNCLSSFFGGPWICAATVRAVSHVSALLVVSTNVVPGESPKVIGVRDQRVSAFTVSVLLGLSVLMGPLLSLVPAAVLFGVFLYMGVSGMNGVQLFDRLKLFIMPVKHHPRVSYVKYVKTWRMFLYTFIQVIGLAILWAVKSSPAAIAFPFFVVGMVPLRKSLKFLFTSRELEMLDGPESGKDLEKDDEEEDFYEAAAELPVLPENSVPLHRSILGVINMTGINIPRNIPNHEKEG